jgi:hypothetical protein
MINLCVLLSCHETFMISCVSFVIVFVQIQYLFLVHFLFIDHLYFISFLIIFEISSFSSHFD